MKNIAIFVSGSGSNMQAIIDAIKKGDINAKVSAVVANKDNIFALERARKEKIDYKVFNKNNYESLDERDKGIIEYLEDKNIDLIILAGYLSILTKPLIDRYEKRIINIHPSLIPKHCGMGFYGERVHKSVLDAKEKETGATVHYVDYGADTGEIIAQETVEVKEGDTPKTLAQRVLKVEHSLLVRVVANILNKQ